MVPIPSSPRHAASTFFAKQSVSFSSRRANECFGLLCGKAHFLKLFFRFFEFGGDGLLDFC
jgi:hypothetical protein